MCWGNLRFSITAVAIKWSLGYFLFATFRTWPVQASSWQKWLICKISGKYVEGVFVFKFCKKSMWCTGMLKLWVTKSFHIFIEKRENFLQITLKQTDMVIKNIRQVQSWKRRLGFGWKWMFYQCKCNNKYQLCNLSHFRFSRAKAPFGWAMTTHY